MGSFNQIGFISKLPIEPGEDTVLIFMRVRDDKKDAFEKIKGGTVYSTDVAEPYFLPIFGKYEDYGYIDDIETTTITEYITNFFDLPILEVIKRINYNAGRSNPDETLIPEKNHKIFRQLTYGLEHRHVYEEMSKMCDDYEKIKSSLINSKKCIDEYNSWSDETKRERLFDYPEVEVGHSVNWYLANTSMDGKFTYSHSTERIPSDIIGVIPDKPILDFINFHQVMEELNYHYLPSSYGAQDTPINKHYKMLSVFREVFPKKISVIVEKYGDRFDYTEMKEIDRKWDRNSRLDGILN
jgi:hypothetical protein